MDITIKSCPFLGMIDDPATFTSFPSLWNCCHNAKPVEAVELTHQQNYCLNENFRTCPVYLRVALSKGDKKALPPKLRVPNSQPGILRSSSLKIISISFLILALLFIAGFRFLNGRRSTGGEDAKTSQSGISELTAPTLSVVLTSTQTPPIRNAETEAAQSQNAALSQTAFAVTQATTTPTLTETTTPTITKVYVFPTAQPPKKDKPKPKPVPTQDIAPTPEG
jgi:hypothetical protein